MPVFKDHLGRSLILTATPKRIVSVVPSQTELLFYLGLDKSVVGITKFCIHPRDKFKQTEKVGGTKQLDLEKIKLLNPDLIIANKEENEKSQIEELAKHFPVWISDIANLPEALDMIKKVGELVDKEGEAQTLIHQIAREFHSLTPTAVNRKVAYFIWRKPFMVAGHGTFIDDMLRRCGLKNAFNLERYPEIDEVTLRQIQPNIVFLSSEPYPFKEKHIAELQNILPKAIVKLVDGEMFSWYGSRLLEAAAYFKSLLNEIK